MPESSSSIETVGRASVGASSTDIRRRYEAATETAGTSGKHRVEDTCRTSANGRVVQVLSQQPAPDSSTEAQWYGAAKRGQDILCACVLSIVAVPIILLASILVKMTSRGPAFYAQVRLGRHGVPFKIYKIRTMVDGCESVTGPCWSVPGDSRATPVGRLLRRTHLDELPQLLNVLRGQMSLIGPRPERPAFLPVLEQALPSYRRRLLVRPGVTGLAQLHLPPDTDLRSVRSKLTCDLYYIEHLSFGLDMRIMVCTVLYAAGVPFRWSRRWFQVPSIKVINRTMPVPVAADADLCLTAAESGQRSRRIV
jgi:lipopolysaccharide/colanic/teichoic acid biosynthesis glycosyltransferase